jgi:hypothetical protein
MHVIERDYEDRPRDNAELNAIKVQQAGELPPETKTRTTIRDVVRS